MIVAAFTFSTHTKNFKKLKNKKEEPYSDPSC